MMKNKAPKIFSACFTASLLLHVAALLCIQKYSLWFSTPQPSQPSENWLSLVEKKERDLILKTTFDPMNAPKEEIQGALHPDREEVSLILLQKSEQDTEIEEFKQTDPLPPIALNEPLITSPISLSFSITSQSFNLLNHLPKDLLIPSLSETSRPLFAPFPANPSVAVSARPPSFQEEAPAALEPLLGKIDLALANSLPIKQAVPQISFPSLPKLPTLEELETSSYSHSFDADLVFLPREDGKGYIFALTLISQPDLELPRLNQQITFLIDRSNSIQQDRLTATKAAVHKALEELCREDTFNMIAFDSKVEKMSAHNLPCNEKSYAAAEQFLEKIQLGSFFSSSDLSRPLFLTVPGEVKTDEIYTAILLTDGENFSKRAAYYSVLQEWTSYNAGKVSLFAISMNDAYLPALDTVAAFNRGKLINAPSYRGLKRKLSKLVKTIQNPVAKNLACHAISRSPQTKIQLFPKGSQMPHLYLDQPYVILGETETLDDFILFVQGRLKGKWLNIKKTVSFLHARKGNKSLREEFALQQAYTLYEKHLLDQDPKHLVEAKALLEPHHFQTAFR